MRHFIPALLVCAVLALSACAGEASPDLPTADSTANAGQAGSETADSSSDSVDVEIEEFKYTRLTDGTRVLTGRLRNATNEPYRRAQIVVSLFGPGNERVATANIDVQDIGAGESTPFRHPLDLDAEVQSARVRDVLVF